MSAVIDSFSAKSAKGKSGNCFENIKRSLNAFQVSKHLFFFCRIRVEGSEIRKTFQVKWCNHRFSRIRVEGPKFGWHSKLSSNHRIFVG